METDDARTRIEAMDDVRKLVFFRMREAMISHIEVSKAIGKNSTYIGQWLHRGSPKDLPEPVRVALAQYLGLDPERLRLKPLPNIGPRPGQWKRPADMPMPVMHDDTVPVFSDTAVVDFALAKEFTQPMPGSPPGSLYGVWISRDHGRLRSGDMAYVRMTQPARRGDTVVVLDGDRRIVGVGELERLGMEEIEVASDRGPISGSRNQYRAQKVVAVSLA